MNALYGWVTCCWRPRRKAAGSLPETADECAPLLASHAAPAPASDARLERNMIDAERVEEVLQHLRTYVFALTTGTCFR